MTYSLALKPTWPWQTHPRETVTAMIAATVGMIALGAAVDAMPTLGLSPQPPIVAQAPVAEATAATQLRDIAPDEALAINAKIPLAKTAIQAAAPFSMGNASLDARAQALECLTSALYYEAGQESDEGQRAVAQVILNRVRHPAFPASVCGVVYQGSTRPTGCQFTFTCDGSLSRAPTLSAWDRARRNAKAMLDGAVYAPVGQATHYHANYVLPYWASGLVKTQVIGAHLFYRWAGNWGQPGAFAQAYAGREANARALRSAALAVPHIVPRQLLAANAGGGAVALDKLAGVEVKANGGRVTAHFSPEAFAAVEKVKVVPYVERVAASDNLRYALDGDTKAAEQPALGHPAEAAAPSATPAQ